MEFFIKLLFSIVILYEIQGYIERLWECKPIPCKVFNIIVILLDAGIENFVKSPIGVKDIEFTSIKC